MVMYMNEIRASYNCSTIRVYQAFNDQIANEALIDNRFGNSFNRERMTWIKPSFLWMMYRSGWGTKSNQNRILSIDIKREGFDYLVEHAVLTTYNPQLYKNYQEWRERLALSDVRCQWDPDRDIEGNPLQARAIQLGIKGNALLKYLNEWIVDIKDISKFVHEIYLKKDICDIKQIIPVERPYKQVSNI